MGKVRKKKKVFPCKRQGGKGADEQNKAKKGETPLLTGNEHEGEERGIYFRAKEKPGKTVLNRDYHPGPLEREKKAVVNPRKKEQNSRWFEGEKSTTVGKR